MVDRRVRAHVVGPGVGRRARGRAGSTRTASPAAAPTPARDRSARSRSAPATSSAQVEGNHGRAYRTDVAVRTLADQRVGPGRRRDRGQGRRTPPRCSTASSTRRSSPTPPRSTSGCCPGAGDLRPHCSCPDWAEPCKHAAAVCYLVADELDRDPFQLFLLRGMDRETLLARVRERRPSASGAAERAASEGVIAKDAWAAQPEGAGLAPVPAEVHALGRLHDHPIGSTPADGLPHAPGIDPAQLAALADDAAVRAWSMLADGAPSGLRSNFNADLARRARATSPALGRRRGLRRERGDPPGPAPGLVGGVGARG